MMALGLEVSYACWDEWRIRFHSQLYLAKDQIRSSADSNDDATGREHAV